MDLRPAQPDDVESMLALRTEVFASTSLASARRRRAWEWDGNPARRPDTCAGHVLLAQDALVGAFSYVPLRVWIDGAEGLALDGVDLCIHANLRGKGAASALVQPLWSGALCDFPFASGLNDASRHLFTRAGGTLLHRPDSALGFAWFPKGSALTDRVGATCHEVARFGDEADALWRGTRHEHLLTTVRDASSLNWRYVDFPFAKCRLVCAEGGRGVAVFQDDATLDRTYLLELWTARQDDDARVGLLRWGCEAAREAGREVLYIASNDDAQHATLIDAHFQPVPGTVPSFIGRLPHHPTVDVQRWTPSLGDGDQLYEVGASRA